MLPTNAPLRVAMSTVALLSHHAGLANYIRNLAHALVETGQVRFRYFYGLRWSDDLRARPAQLFASSSSAARRWLPAAWELSRAVQGLAFAREARAGAFDLYHEPAYLLHGERLPAIVTVHDLSFIHYPETHPAGRVRILERRLPRSLSAARKVLTDSESVREEVIRHFGVPAAKVHAVPLGVASRFKPRAATELQLVLDRYRLQSSGYVLSVGTLEPRKNLVRVLQAYASLSAALRARYPLVIVGASGWHEGPIVAKLDPLVRRGEVRFLGYVDDKTLSCLYSGARAAAYVSLYEGFGLPIAEAMASGAPVLTSNVGCMRELAEGAALLVDPSADDAIAGGLARLLSADDECARLRAAGLERVRALTWADCARRTIEIYRLALAG
ncbi:MAG TPA: glycosyltransferase family 1 protein [Burkholderiales bacterium]|nr:glycosyltransferase family 1 protein [Burkholderiales bacterium]